MAANYPNHRSDGRLRKNREAMQSAKLLAPLVHIPHFQDVQHFNCGDFVFYDSQRETKHITGQGGIERVTYFNGYWYRIRVNGEQLDFRADELKRIAIMPQPLPKHKQPTFRLWFRLQCLQQFLAWLVRFLISDWRLIIDHMVAITPRYVLWRLPVEAQQARPVIEASEQTETTLPVAA